VRIGEGRTGSVRVRLSRSRYRALLAEMRRSGLRRVKVTAVATVGTADGKRTICRTVRLKR
jgi:hypothetical protein